MNRVVVVADNSLIVEAIAIGLRQSGEFNLLGSVDGRNASLQSILGASPDLILVDDTEHSGPIVDLVREIKAEQQHIMVIVLTMTMDEDWLDAIFEAGATGAISKATNPAALATLVRETVNGNVVHVYKPMPRTTETVAQESPPDDSSLTTRELEVLRLVAAGATNGEIARKLWVTEQTVKFHLSNVYRKLDVGNRTEASHYAHVNGLLSDRPHLVVS